MSCGLYQIVNTRNNGKYVGSSIHIEERQKEHLRMLGAGRHHSRHLQRAWNKYGSQSFRFETLCEVEKEHLKESETLALAMVFESSYPVYNVSRDATSPMRGRKHSAEWVARAKEWTTGNKSRTGVPSHWKGKQLSNEHRAKLKAAKQNVSKETREKMRAKRLGVSPANKGVRQTHCKRGHEKTKENTYSYRKKSGDIANYCRTCMKINSDRRNGAVR